MFLSFDFDHVLLTSTFHFFTFQNKRKSKLFHLMGLEIRFKSPITFDFGSPGPIIYTCQATYPVHTWNTRVSRTTFLSFSVSKTTRHDPLYLLPVINCALNTTRESNSGGRTKNDAVRTFPEIVTSEINIINSQ